MIRKSVLFLMMIAGFFSLYIGHDLVQRNPETIFLTAAGIKDYQNFSRTFSEKKSIIIKVETTDENEFYRQLKHIQILCTDSCEIILPASMARKIQNQEGIINLKSSSHLAVLIMDDNDLNLKKILTFTEKDPYWGHSGVSVAGIPYTNFLLDKYSLVIQEKLFPAMFILGLIISFVFINRFSHSLLVYLPCLFSAGFSLGTLKLIHNEMNMVSAIIPLVVFTVGLGLSFHLYFSLKELGAIKEVLSFKWKPFFLMIFTTYIGFLSLGMAEIEAIKEFGIIAAHLVILSTVFTILWFYLLEKDLHFSAKQRFNILRMTWFERTLSGKIIWTLGIAGLLSIIFFVRQLPVVTDATEYFPEKDHIKQKMTDVTSTVAGIPLAEIHFKLTKDLDVGEIKALERAEQQLLLFLLPEKMKVISNNRLVEMANGFYSGKKEIPQSLESYLLLRGQLPSGLQESYPVEKDYRLTIIGQPMNSGEYQYTISHVRRILTQQQLNYRINGLYYNLMMSQEAMIRVLAESFISSAVIIFIFSAFFLRTLKKFLVFIFVSLLPVALTFAGMKLFGFSINIATVMTFSIALGLVGDSSFHIIYAKDVRFKTFSEYSAAVLYPVVGSGLLLVICFLIFTVNDFVPIRQFGGILAMILFLGTLVDLYVLPTLLYGSVRHREKYEHTIE